LSQQDARIKGIHELRIVENNDKLSITMHVELEGKMDLREAHEVAEALEKRIMGLDGNIGSVTTHIEPLEERCQGISCPDGVALTIKQQIAMVVCDFPEVKEHEIAEIIMLGDRAKVNLICRMDPNIGLEEAHSISIRLENAIRSSVDCVEEISVHMEPAA
jgi:divalent metal cation (Fe/Co/Zn/Cd) transporter